MSTDSETPAPIFAPDLIACAGRWHHDDPHRVEIHFNRALTGAEFMEISTHLTGHAQGWRPDPDALGQMVEHPGGGLWFQKGAPELAMPIDELLPRKA